MNMKKNIILSCVIIFLIVVSLLGANLTQARQGASSNSPVSPDASLNWFPWKKTVLESLQNPPIDYAQYISLKITPFSDQPYIAIYDSQNQDLWVGVKNCYTGNCMPLNDWGFYVVDTGNDVGSHLSMDIWGNSWQNYKIGISYYDATNRTIKVWTHTCNPSCSDSARAIENPLGPDYSLGLFTSFKFDSTGVARVAYYNSHGGGSDELKYAYQVSSGGNCGLWQEAGKWNCIIVDSGEGRGQYAALDVSWDDNVDIAYYDATYHDLRLAQCIGHAGNCAADQWSLGIIESNGADVGKYVAMRAKHDWDSPLQAVYYDQTNGHLKYYNSYMGAPFVVDDMSTMTTPHGISMDLDPDGYPVIAYQQPDPYAGPHLGIARPYFVYGKDMGNCGEPAPGQLFPYFYCTTLDYGSQNTEVANIISAGVRANGLVDIAYSEYDSFYENTNLDFIYQFTQSFLPLVKKP